jgi:hypothetical protein
VIDDQDQEAFKRESSILSSLASITLYQEPTSHPKTTFVIQKYIDDIVCHAMLLYKAIAFLQPKRQ